MVIFPNNVFFTYFYINKLVIKSYFNSLISKILTIKPSSTIIYLSFNLTHLQYFHSLLNYLLYFLILQLNYQYYHIYYSILSFYTYKYVIKHDTKY